MCSVYYNKIVYSNTDYISKSEPNAPLHIQLTHWGRVTHICVGKLSIIGSDNGLSPNRRQAIIWTNVGILLTGILGTNFSEISIEIYTFSFKKMHLKMSSGNWRPFCLGLNVLIWHREVDRLLNFGDDASHSRFFFTRDQFWPSGIVVACVCLCVCPSVRLSVRPCVR